MSIRRLFLQYQEAGGGLLLDLYPNASGAYSLRYLSSAYGGAVVRVRRDSDNLEQDFTPSQITDGTLLTFIGVNNGYISIWYDQSGNTINANQTTVTSQPLIVNGGILTTEPDFGNNAMYFDGIDDYFNVNKVLTSPNAFIIASNTNGITRGTYLGGASNRFIRSDSNYDIANTSSLSTGSQTNKLDLIYANNISSEIGVNGAVASVGSLAQANWISPFAIGQKAFQNYLKGYFCELIIYEIDKSANRSGIEDNINGYYSIY